MQQETTFHNIHASEDGIFNTVSGKTINIHEPTEDMFCIDDIASALSKICRFGGQTNQFYSVAQHCVLVSALAGPRWGFEALLHDATEAYLGDVVKPLKVILGPVYSNIETNFETVIAAKFGMLLNEASRSWIKLHDRTALELEHLAFQQNKPLQLTQRMHELGLMKQEDPLAWSPEIAKVAFLSCFSSLNTADFIDFPAEMQAI